MTARPSALLDDLDTALLALAPIRRRILAALTGTRRGEAQVANLEKVVVLARKASDLDPLKLDPKHYKLEFENDQVRVLRVRFGPNEKGVLHEHTMNHVVVYLNDQRKGKAGEFRLDPPETHTEENPLDHAVERIAIDIK